MKYGYVKVASAAPEIRVADPEFNASQVIGCIAEAEAKGVKVLVLPELCLTGSTCGDLFYPRVLLLGAERGTIGLGLWGYSAALTAPAVGCIFNAPDPRALAHAASATLLAVLLQAAAATAVQPLGIPVLTLPFVLATWVFLLLRTPPRA